MAYRTPNTLLWNRYRGYTAPSFSIATALSSV